MSSSDLKIYPATVETATAPAPKIQRIQSDRATIHSISTRRSSDLGKYATTVEPPSAPVPNIQIIQFAHTLYTRALSPFCRYTHFVIFFGIPMAVLNICLSLKIPSFLFQIEGLTRASIYLRMVLLFACMWSEFWLWRASKMLIKAGITRVDRRRPWEMEDIFETYLDGIVDVQTGMEMGDGSRGLAKRDDDAHT